MCCICSGGDELPWQQEVDLMLQSVRDVVQASDTLLQLLDLARAWPDGVFVDDIGRYNLHSARLDVDVAQAWLLVDTSY